MPGLLVISVVLLVSSSDNLKVALTVPPQARSMTIPVNMKLPNSPALKSGMQWQLSEGRVHIPAQVEGSSLSFLLPVSASKAELRRTLLLEQVSGDNKPMFTLKEAEAKYLRVFEGDTPVLTYNFGMILNPGVPEDRRRSSYVHPLYAPDGTLLTDDFPADHLHHRGLSWMWPNVDVGAEHHSLWDIRGIKQRFERWLEKSAGPVCARIGAENGWYTGEKKVAREQILLTVFRAAAGGRAVDVLLIFEATGNPVRLTGELPDKKGYGGLSLRFAPRQDTVITTSGGLQEKDSNLVAFPWADLSARFGASGAFSGAAIFVGSQNPGFPNGWTLRNYGFLGVAWPGMQPVTLEPGKPITLRYRLWLHAGNAEVGCVAAEYDAFITPPQTLLEPTR